MDIQRLVSLAFPGPRNDASDVIGRDAFIDSLNDDQLSLKVREREPPTLDDAAKIAMRLESYQTCHQTGNPLNIDVRVKETNCQEMDTLKAENASMKLRLDQLERRMKHDPSKILRDDTKHRFDTVRKNHQHPNSGVTILQASSRKIERQLHFMVIQIFVRTTNNLPFRRINVPQ